MLIDSMESAESDFAARLLIDARNDADIVIRSTDKAMKRADEFLTFEEKQAILKAEQNCAKHIKAQMLHWYARKWNSSIMLRKNSQKGS